MDGPATGTWELEAEYRRPQKHRVAAGSVSLNLSRLVFVRNIFKRGSLCE